ncbi:MAG: PRC-barrel domain-containing protein, partial [Acidobacteriota bacterium]
MLLSTNDMQGFSIHATDGDIGKAVDCYFDDQDWTIRYVMADVGSWLESRKVLISPVSIPTVAPDLKRFMT